MIVFLVWRPTCLSLCGGHSLLAYPVPVPSSGLRGQWSQVIMTRKLDRSYRHRYRPHSPDLSSIVSEDTVSLSTISRAGLEDDRSSTSEFSWLRGRTQSQERTQKSAHKRDSFDYRRYTRTPTDFERPFRSSSPKVRSSKYPSSTSYSSFYDPEQRTNTGTVASAYRSSSSSSSFSTNSDIRRERQEYQDYQKLNRAKSFHSVDLPSPARDDRDNWQYKSMSTYDIRKSRRATDDEKIYSGSTRSYSPVVSIVRKANILTFV